MPRVLFVAPSAYPLGGVAVWLDYLVKGLPAHGWSPTVGLVSGRWHDVERYTAAYPGWPWIAIENPTGSAEGRQRALAAAIRRQAPDVVVGVNIADIYGASHRLRRKGDQSFRTIMAIHGIAADLLGDLDRERSHIDGVIGTNRLICRLCSDFAGMSIERVHYAPYGVDVEKLSALRRATCAAGPIRIAYVGRLDDEQKRVGMIPEILRHLDRRGVNFRIDIAGDGPMKEELRESLAPWLADGRATMLGTVPPESLGKQVYARADVLLVTSSWETGPIVVWEAMAAGVPVVTSRYVGSGLEGALEHEENCLMFAAGDTGAAATQLQRLRSERVEASLVAKARRLVNKRYSIRRSVRVWADCLDAIRKRPPIQGNDTWARPPARGRLDRIVGVELSESLRRSLGISFQHYSAGGEWPHSLSLERSDAGFLESVRVLDAS